MCLFSNKRSKRNEREIKEKEEEHAYLVKLYSPSHSPKSSVSVTGKRQSDQTLANPHPHHKSSHSSSENGASLKRMSREQRNLPMPKQTPGGLSENPVSLGASNSTQKSDMKESKTNTGMDYSGAGMGYPGYGGSDQLNAAASVGIVMTGDGGYYGHT